MQIAILWSPCGQIHQDKSRVTVWSFKVHESTTMIYKMKIKRCNSSDPRVNALWWWWYSGADTCTYAIVIYDIYDRWYDPSIQVVGTNVLHEGNSRDDISTPKTSD